MADEPLSYDPRRFSVDTIGEAAALILTPEGVSTEERWQTETPYLIDLIGEHCGVAAGSMVLDFGCGIGRLAKGLIERYGCRVVGVDLSPSMRGLAHAYVNDPRFFSCAPEALDWLPVKFDAALAVWVFQHCLDPAADIERVKSALAPGAPLFAVNSQFRLVPTTAPGDWSDDGVDVFALLDARLARTSSELLSPNFVPAHIAAQSVWGVWRRS